MFDRSSQPHYLPITADLMTPQAKMRVFDTGVEDFAKIERRLTPGEISMRSFDRAMKSEQKQ